MSPTTLPALNALLNLSAAILLITGHRMIKKGRIDLHRKCMIWTFALSCVFLASYLTYHTLFGSQPFWGTGWLRTVYLIILSTHSVTAAAIVPLAIITLRRGLKRDDKRHRKIAKWTYPLWVYVSVTGVAIYVILYQLKPAGM